MLRSICLLLALNLGIAGFSGEAASVNSFYGSFTTEIPIAVPQYHDLQPNLKLVYSSSGTDGFVGVGWSLSGLSMVERGRPGGGSPRYDSGDAYFLDGMELVPDTSRGGSHATKVLNYARIQHDTSGNRWLVTGTNGNQAIYADRFTNSNGTFRWYLSSVTDTHGNQVDYNYFNDGYDMYLSTITYNGTTVTFHRNTRPDVVTFATGAGLGKTLKRLSAIDVSVSGQRARAYKLTYDASPNTGRSRLISVRQYGTDAVISGGQVIGGWAMAPMNIDYHEPTQGHTFTNSYVTGGWGGSGYTWGADFNGDGRADLASAYGGSVRMKLTNSSGTGFTAATWTVPNQWASSGYTWTGDYNGDGMADIATAIGSNIHVRLSTGSGFNSQIWSIAGWWGGSEYSWSADFNGDGLTDVASANGGSVYVYLSTGSGFTSHIWSVPSQWGGAGHTRVADFNGDGRSDIASMNGGSVYMHLSTGTSFINETWSVPSQWGGAGYTWTGDFNGDGKSDIASANGSNVYVRLSTGEGFNSQTWTVATGWASSGYTWAADFDGDRRTDIATAHGGNLHVRLNRGDHFDHAIWTTSSQWGGSSYCRVGDFNGDGRADIVSPDGNYVRYRYSTGQPTDRLSDLSNGIGGTTDVTYSSSAEWDNNYLPLGLLLQTVDSVTVSDGRGNSNTTSYSYEGGLWSNTERRFLGFRKVTSVLDAQGSYTETFYLQQEGSISKPEFTYYKDNQGNIFNYSTYAYDYNLSPPYYSLLTDRWDFECNLTGQCRRTLTQFTYDSYANVINTYDWGDYDVTGDELTQLRTYVPNTSIYLTGLPAYDITYQGIGTSGNTLGMVLYSYDNNSNAMVQPTKGDLTKIQKWLDTNGQYATTHMTYDTYGNMISETNELGHTSTVAFDATYHVYPVGATNALGHTSSREWNTTLGLETATVDANGARTENTYDPLGRRTSVTWPDGNVTTFDYFNWGSPTHQRVRETKPDGSADGLWEETWQDGLGRVWKVVQEGGITKETVYSGTEERIELQSLPYYTGDPIYWTTYSYDGSGRLRVVTLPDGAQSEVQYLMDANGKPYELNYDPLGNERAVWKDTRGNVTQVREKIDGTYAYTNYVHDAQGRLIRTVDNAVNQVSFAWDSLGRKTSMDDPDMGVWTYGYDLAGQLVVQTDALGQSTRFTYDALGRMRTKTDADGLISEWIYDEAGHGSSKGRLTRLEHPLGGESHYWDLRGQETAVVYEVDGVSNYLSRSYDSLGRLSTLQYTNGEQLKHHYDSQGRLSSVSGYVDAMSWNAAGQLESITYANGVTSDYSYDAHRQWLETADVRDRSNTLLYNAGFNHDLDARVTSATSTTHSQGNQSYTYDSIDRLRSVGGGITRSYNYDSLGNLTYKSDLGSYGYAAGSIHAASKAGGNSYKYDANGSMTSRNGQALTWDAQNRLVGISGAGVNETYGYGADNERLRKDNNGVVTRYFGAHYVDTDGDTTYYYFAGPIRVAKKISGKTFYYHADRLNSTKLITDSSGKVAKDYTYSPFGQVVNQSGTLSNAIGFNGHESDTSGLVYMRARFYDPGLGRFISADATVPDPSNPQAFNRYAFVYNNPVCNVDPTGHAPVAAAIISAVVTTAVSSSTLITATAWVGAGLSVAGYYLEDPLLSTIGSVMLGFAGGYTNPGSLSNLTGGVIGGLGALSTSPISPLGDDAKMVSGWAFGAFGHVNGLRSGVEYTLHTTANVAASVGVSHLAEALGLDGGEFNVALTALSFAGNYFIGSRYQGVSSGGVNGPYEKISGVSSRGMWGLPFDVVDIVLGYQGLPTASSYEYMFKGNHELPLLGFSLGSLDANNLGGMGVPGNSVTAVSLPAFNGGAPGVQVYVGTLDPVNGFSLFGKIFSPYSTVQSANLFNHARGEYPILIQNNY